MMGVGLGMGMGWRVMGMGVGGGMRDGEFQILMQAADVAPPGNWIVK